jgi:hypothetical protein
MRREIYAGAAAIHLVIAALFSTHVQVEKYVPEAIERPLRIYGGYTGADTHFNFFAPAVPTQPRVHFVLTGRDGSQRTVDLMTPSAEVNQRLANMLSIYELAAARPLVVRSWALYVLARHPEAQSAEVRVEILDIPTIAQAHAGKRPAWVEVERTVVRRDEPY